MIDPETGKLAIQGWLENGEMLVTDNSETDANPLGHKSLNILRKRGVNFTIIQTPNHYISLLSPVDFGFMCINKVEIFNISEGPKRRKDQLFELPVICPTASPTADSIIISDPKFDLNFGVD